MRNFQLHGTIGALFVAWLTTAARADSAVGLNGTQYPYPISGLESGVTAVAVGWNHSFGIQNGGAYGWGKNDYGQLGDGTRTNRLFTPAPVMGLESGVTVVAAGTEYSLAVQNGAVYAWGRNSSGQLGDGTSVYKTSPVPVIGMGGGVTAIAAGFQHCLAIQNGALFAWGEDSYGELGDGTSITGDVVTRTTAVPVISMGSGVTDFSAGSFYTLAIKDGVVFAWGKNTVGRLGDGTTTDRSIPVPVTGLPSGATAVAAGLYDSLAVVNGNVYAWGVSGIYTTTPALVDPGTLNSIVAVATPMSGNRYYALSSDGRLWRWSSPTLGIEELLPPAGYKFTSISAGGSAALATVRDVPEPSTFILAAAALGLCVARCRRRLVRIVSRRSANARARLVNRAHHEAQSTLRPHL